MLRWMEHNLHSQVLADSELRPAILSVSGIPVIHGKGWVNETDYQKYIHCDGLSLLDAKFAVMRQPCPGFDGAVYSGNYQIVTTR